MSQELHDKRLNGEFLTDEEFEIVEQWCEDNDMWFKCCEGRCTGIEADECECCSEIWCECAFQESDGLKEAIRRAQAIESGDAVAIEIPPEAVKDGESLRKFLEANIRKEIK